MRQRPEGPGEEGLVGTPEGSRRRFVLCDADGWKLERSGSNPASAPCFCTWEAKLFDRRSGLGVKVEETVHCSEKLLEGLTQGARSLTSCCWSVEDLIKVDCMRAGGCSGRAWPCRGGRPGGGVRAGPRGGRSPEHSALEPWFHQRGVGGRGQRLLTDRTAEH